MVKLPKIKKDVNAFLIGEEGKISKQSLMKAGVLLSAATIGAISESDDASAHYSHSNTISMSYGSWTVSSDHSNHGSHGSHGSHGQW